MKRKILWITADYFVDCDLIPIRELSDVFDIEWVVIISGHNPRYNEAELETYRKTIPTLKATYFYINYIRYDFRSYFANKRIGEYCSKIICDAVYLNVGIGFPWVFGLWKQLPIGKTIITAHQGEVHDGMRPKWLHQYTRDKVYKRAVCVNMFSKSQSRKFLESYPDTNLHVIPLTLKDYGQPSVNVASSKDREIVFLSFGVIAYGKHIDLLIDAACNLYEKGVRGFKVKICGNCHFWGSYQSKIRYKEIFDNDIRHIDNSRIPDLFASAHYVVQPYRIVTQSGVTKIAYNYYTPLIVSRLDGFMDEFEESVSGYSFESENVEDLERVMRYAIEHHKDYDGLVEKMHAFVDSSYSDKVIREMYLKMFNDIIGKE